MRVQRQQATIAASTTSAPQTLMTQSLLMPPAGPVRQAIVEEEWEVAELEGYFQVEAVEV